MNNIGLLGLDLGKAKAFGLSHGHFDHFMAAVEILKQNQTRIAQGTPFYVGEEAFYRRYSLRPGTNEAMDIGQLRKEDIEGLGMKVKEVKTPTQIIPGAYLHREYRSGYGLRKGAAQSSYQAGRKTRTR